MKRKLVCIVCPKGCEIDVDYNEKTKEVYSLSGHSCRRGEEYARAECIAPMRALTTTMRVEGGALVPVRTSKPVPRSMLFDCMKAINAVSAPSDVTIGAVILKDILGTGADIVASGNIVK